jgi:hypothetical protein
MILDAAQELEEGDIFLFTFAGHGSRRSDEDNDENDFMDETILLFDRIMIDDFMRRALWSQFRPGVRIVGVADCCHSGTALMTSLNVPTPEPVGLFPSLGHVDVPIADFELSASPALSVVQGVESFGHDARPQRQSERRGRADYSKQPLSPYDLPCVRQTCEEVKPTVIPIMREISTEASKTHLERFTGIYKELKEAIPTGNAAKLKANLLTLAACKDSEKTPDGLPNGLFTQTLLQILNSTNPPANYTDLIRKIGEKPELASRPQTPLLKFAGPGQNFSDQLPFSI